ncbi:TPA: HNH endonuclease [Morganella morganii]|uniref:HNH endonuclease n=1 Tax=Morganella morganii TaxID=582 RepID=UPI001BDA4E5A|nr:HNH endonuclease [Morganella morganii]MBT0379588.1 HNH endonuclease [Morganella morganii subsp. morganii]HDU8610350.1 HNH endonuclease [Morganella morganii]
MERVKSIVYRHLTNADFFNINKPPGMELGGGGQAYIDFPTSSVTPAQWHEFFIGINGVSVQQETQGPSWIFPIYSLTLDNGQNPAVQSLKIYQRRQQSVSITSQKLFSSRSNRVRAWHPQSGFPVPVDNTDRSQCPDGLMVYLAATYEGRVWAGWFLNDGTTQLPLKGIPPQSINSMFSLPADAEGYSGIINFHSTDYLYLNPLDRDYPLQSQGTETYTSGVYNPANDESTFIDDLFYNDNSQYETLSKEYIRRVKARNKSIVTKLKNLYNNTCQITGNQFAFQKKDGIDYTEVHHLIPLGEGGSDDIRNLIVVNPLIHKMLHHATVTGLNLENISIDEHGVGTLQININDLPYTITWHPKHTALI